MKRSILVIMCIISIYTTIIMFYSTYSRYSEQANANLETNVGKWNIKLNNTDITQGNTYEFLIEDITIFENENVVPGKIAPGLSGYFDINIDPSNTDVSVRYDVSVNTEELSDSKIQISDVSEISGNSLIKTDKNTYTGVILLEDIKEGTQNTIRIFVEWDAKDEINGEDYDFANRVDNVYKMPITVKVTQYLGEQIDSDD